MSEMSRLQGVAPIAVSVYRLLPIILILLFSTVISACRPEGYIYNRDGAVECGADGDPIILINNPAAIDPTFEELIDFIQTDTTDLKPYIDDVYVCADYAEDIHNNAEAAGIRAGWVGIMFDGVEIGHAVNIFQTTDRGTVYVDCTGSSDPLDETETSRDMIAYIQEGKKYGVIHVDKMLNSGFEYFSLQYSYYEQEAADWQEYKELLTAFNEEVASYNKEIAGKTYIIGSPEEKKISSWERELTRQSKMLENMERDTGGNWYESEYSSYTVSDVQISW